MRRTFNTSRVITAIENTAKLDKAYLEATLAKHIHGGAGSVFDNIDSIEEMKLILCAANWEQTEHEGVAPDKVAFVTKDIPGGLYGMISIAELPDDVELTAIAPKRNNRVSLSVSGVERCPVDETWLIVATDPESGMEFMLTFHPGQPIDPSLVMGDKLIDGQKVSKAEALALGYIWANIV